MLSQTSTIVQYLWNYCNVLRDDGVSYGDHVEQLTYLLFLKMADEQVRELGKQSAIPQDLSWSGLLRLDGDTLEGQYLRILKELGQRSGLIGVIFRKAQNRIQEPAHTRALGRVCGALQTRQSPHAHTYVVGRKPAGALARLYL